MSWRLIARRGAVSRLAVARGAAQRLHRETSPRPVADFVDASKKKNGPALRSGPGELAMRVAFSTLIAGARGKLAGVIFSAGKAGAFVRPYAAPSNPKTALQQTHRAAFSGPGARWRALSSSQRAAWSTWAALPAQEKTDPFGNPYYASGWNWFVALHTQASLAAASPPDDPPTASRPTIPSILSVTVTATPTSQCLATFSPGEFDGLYCTIALSICTASTAANPAPAAARYFAAGPFGPTDAGAVFLAIDTSLGTVQSGYSFRAAVAAQNSESDRSPETVIVGSVT